MQKLILIILFVSQISIAQDKAPAVWPREFDLGSQKKITIYQPQVDSLKGDALTVQSAFKLNEDKKDVYGSFSLKSKALISKDQGVVTIRDIVVTDVQLPQGKTSPQTLKEDIQVLLKGKELQVPYQTLVNNLNIQIGEEARPQLKNEPPHFIYTKRPSILIMISGDPVWGESKGAKEVKRVMNTSALILNEKDKDYYLWALGQWFTAKQLMGPYKLDKEPSSKLVMIKDELVKEKKIDPIAGKTAEGKSVYPPGEVPDIILSTKPAELLQSSGEPKFQAVQGTGLLYMSNSPNSIFMDSKSQDYFVLVTGRWFSSQSLAGPWRFVEGTKLPADFKKIPVTSPVAEVLVSVPGTPQAKEGQIVSSIPQMAQVKKDLKPKPIECDGKQKWESITGTDLKYAPNCNTPIIQVTDKQFYAVQDGVWFVSSAGLGPWNVATVVPEQIYKIPSSSPLYYVTYVHIYGASGDYVTVGYTPGYHGTYVSADGTIVYGTGYFYPSYVTDAYWYPAPSTYGYGAGYGWDYGAGFYMGFAWGSWMYPWGGGYCCYGGIYVDIDVRNTYTNWGRHTVITGSGGRGVTVNKIGDQKFYRAHGSGEIYTAHDGQVYRRTGKGEWQRNVGPGTWDPVQKPDTPQLEQMHQSREMGNRQYDAQRSRPQADINRNLHGGGGMRAGGFRGGGGGFRR
ncbi:hypothetical protein [Bdellovibrio sp. HCB2-146]|uniref:hypothetical protein n=1 Tax=Bdellovibrio sp. HCB2-146 TaxID=3394362 RepID=UPI0039BCB020